MSRDFRPYPGCRLMGSWPLDEPLPAGWHRDDPTSVSVWRIATEALADEPVEVTGYASADCGVANARTGTAG